MALDPAHTYGMVKEIRAFAVEDEATLLERTAAFFVKVFDRLAGAANGEEALERWASEPFEPPISDIRCPVYRG